MGGRARARAWSKARATQQAGMGSSSGWSLGSDPEMVMGGLVFGMEKTNKEVGWRRKERLFCEGPLESVSHLAKGKTARR